MRATGRRLATTPTRVAQPEEMIMEHIASAYGRALFPHRYEPRGGDRPGLLPPGGLELDLAGAVYRLTDRLEDLWDTISRQRAAWRQRRVGGRPVECG
jgi:hypothetical protein